MADDYDDDDDRPRRRPARRVEDDDDDDRPRARRRRHEDEDDEEEDDRPRRRRRRDEEDEDDDGITSRVVPYKNGPALAAYYCGIFGLIPVAGFVLGPIALILGVLGLIRVRNNPRAHGTGHAITGIVLGLIDPILWVAILWIFWDPLFGPNKQ